MDHNQDYAEKFARIAPATLYPLLTEDDRQRVHRWAHHLRFTQQELRQVSEMLRDLAMWQTPFVDDAAPTETSREAKRQLLARLAEHHRTQTEQGPHYTSLPRRQEIAAVTPLTAEKTRLGLGWCPVASPKTRCCNLLTLDMVENCGFGCSYCSIQSFYGEREVRFDRTFGDKLDRLELDPAQTYHIGTGQSSDSLMWGNSHGALDALLRFARKHPNVILELKSKSANIGHLLKADLPPNLICTWSLNPQQVIDHEEHGTASLEKRLAAARALADRGALIGFHFHPMIRFAGWQAAYRDIVRLIQRDFSTDETLLISLGTLTYIKPVIRKLRQEGRTSKILQMPLAETAGKLSYPEETKIELFRSLYQDFAPEWRERVFFYLCMEDPKLWQPVFGFDYPSNRHFEQAMLDHYRRAIARIRDQRQAP